MRYLLLFTMTTTFWASCSSDAPLFCDIDQPCSAGHPYCDVEGVCPGSGGHANTCLPAPCWDGGIATDADPTAPDADPNAPDAAVDGGPVDGAPPEPDARPTDWSTPAIVTGVVPQGFERHPGVSNDALSLYFTRYNNGTDIYVATRAATSLPFGTPGAVSELNGIYEDTDPETSPNHLEMYYVESVAGPGTAPFIKRSTRVSTAVSWGTPTYLDSDFYGVSPSLSGDALSMYFVGARDSECTNGAPCLKRTTRSSLAGAWAIPTEIAFTPPADYYHIDISADQLSLLVSGRDINATSQPQVLISTRNSLNEGFTAFTEIPQLDIAQYVWDATWNSDETEIYFAAGAFETYRIYVSVLQ